MKLLIRNGRVVYLPQPPSGIQESCEDRMADQEMLERSCVFLEELWQQGVEDFYARYTTT